MNQSITYYICKEKKYVFAEVWSPQITKKIGSTNPASIPEYTTLRQVRKSYFSPEFADLRFAELIVLADRPLFTNRDQFWLLHSDVFPIIYVHKTGKFVKHIENVKELFLMVYVY